MDTLNLIENALSDIDQARFQELCDTYLYRRGYRNINVVGRMAGAHKTRKGRPDTFFPQEDGTYIFAEYTTENARLMKKLLADIAGCFDLDDTGLRPGAVTEVVLCHNRRVEPSDVESLRTECARNGASLSHFGLDHLAQDIYFSHPGLARDFLGVAIDTGQIVSVDEFIEGYQKSPLATPLTTTLRFRDDELKALIRQIGEDDIVLVTGAAGVGKTRLALEACRRFAEANPTTVFRCIRNVHADLFEDLRVYLGPDGEYLLFVDDANRITRFDYIASFFSEVRAGRSLKVVATVRDYALGAVEATARAAATTSLVNLGSLTDKQIAELVRDEFNIKNHLYQEVIVRIAQGNARLAVMAANVAAAKNTLGSIEDASSLYDEYFGSVRSDLEELRDPILLRAAFALSLFRNLDRGNEEQMRLVNEVFGMSTPVLWDALKKLHRAEVVDIYENEVARFSDQVTSTYLVYLAVFREKLVSLSGVLKALFPSFRDRLIDLIFPVVGVFRSDHTLAHLHEQVEEAWGYFDESNDRSAIWELMDVFWFVRRGQTLAEIGRQIEAMEPTSVSATDIEFDKGASLKSSPILSVLANFRNDRDLYPTAIEYLFRYLEIRPTEANLVYHLLTHGWGVGRHSFRERFEAEQILMDQLWERASGGECELFARLYAAVAEPLLHTHFQSFESTGERSVMAYKFELPDSPEVLALRERVWGRLFLLIERSAPLREAVVQLVEKHSQAGYQVGKESIVKKDFDILKPLLRSKFDPNSFRECLVVHDYVAHLVRLGVDVDESLVAHFSSDTYGFAELLFDDRFERTALGWEAYQEEQRQRLSAHAAQLQSGDFCGLFAQCEEILLAARDSHREYQVRQNTRDLLCAIGDRDRDLFEEAVCELLRIPGALGLDPHGLVAKLLERSGPQRTHEILQAADSSVRKRWHFVYLCLLPEAAIDAAHVAEIYNLYDQAEPDQIYPGLGFLLKYVSIDPEIVPRVTTVLLKKGGAHVGRIFAGALNHEESFADRLLEIYGDNAELLKRAYLAAAAADRHSDMDAAVFSKVLELDLDFVKEWVEFVHSKHQWPSEHDDSRDYSLLWLRPDFADVMDRLLRAMLENDRHRGFFGYQRVFFKVQEGVGGEAIRHRQDQYLAKVIATHAHDREMMELAFSVVSEFGTERRRALIAEFLSCNDDVQAFRELRLEPNHWGVSGSFVPTLQGRIDFFESLIPLMSSAPLLEHRALVEKQVAALRAEMAIEKKRDFLRG